MASTVRMCCFALATAAGLGHPAFGADDRWYTKIRIDVLRAFTGLTGAGVNIGQTESGVPRYTHVSLADQFGFARAGGTVTNHATRTGSILVGEKTVAGGDFKGVAPGAELFSSWTGSAAGAVQQARLFKQSADWHLLAPRSHIVNVSWGKDWDETAAHQQGVSRVADWMADTHGILYVCAAGNEGTEAGTAGGGYGTITNPGYAYNTLTVGATNAAGNFGQLRGTSSRAAAGQRVKPDLVAPGQGIRAAHSSSNTAFGEENGTSFATPQVTGTVALLHEHGAAKGFSRSPLVMRSVLMNSTTKSVAKLDGTRWDRDPTLGKGAASISNETGTGQLDAMAAYLQYDAGRHAPTFGTGAGGADVPLTGWDLGALTGTGEGNSNDYLMEKALRKGSYLISTLNWNRGVNTDPDNDSTENPADEWTYRALNNFDLGVAELGDILSIRQRSNATDGAAEHMVYKVQNAKQHYVRAWSVATPDAGRNAYGLTWDAWEIPDTLNDFNGRFRGDRLALLDNGWFDSSSIGATSDVTEPAFQPIGPDRWAMTLTPSVALISTASMSQELVTPTSGLSLSFDIGFDFDFAGSMWVEVGGLNLLSLAEDADGLVMPTLGLNIEQYQRISIDLTQDAFATLSGSFQDLRFLTASSLGSFGNVYIDNVRYTPTPGTLALAGLMGVFTTRRRR